MANILAEEGLVVTQLLTWLGNVATFIVGQPLIMISFGAIALGTAIAYVKRLV